MTADREARDEPSLSWPAFENAIVEEALRTFEDALRRKLREVRDGMFPNLTHPGQPNMPDQTKSQYQRVAEALMAKGNKPRTANWIVKATGISRNSLSQILHRTHKDSFISHAIPGYSRKKLWSLSEEAAGAVGQLASPFTQPTLFGREGDLSQLTGMDCCARILRDHGNQPMDALTMAEEAMTRGYRGRARGKESENEVLLTVAKGFWAALGRDDRFEQVRPLVFRLTDVAAGSPP